MQNFLNIAKINRNNFIKRCSKCDEAKLDLFEYKDSVFDEKFTLICSCCHYVIFNLSVLD